MIGTCACSSAACPGKGISGPSCRWPTRCRREGTRSRSGLKAESVRTALGRVLGEPAFADAAHAIAAEIGEMDTADEAAAAVEEFIAGG